ncbi:MAG: phosphatase [Eubacteriales bacterium]|nr:phosphatase [Eubacteriales bacterium]
MKVAVDTHTHTIASGHAYNTIREMALMASQMGLEALAITDHGPMMPGGPHDFYFHNIRVLPREYYGIPVLFGAELNIMDEKGRVDLPERIIERLDITVASLHSQCYGESKGFEKNTEAYLKIMQRMDVDIIGHPDDGYFEADYEALVDMAKKTGTLLEVNNSSLTPGGSRRNTYENDLQMLKLCKKTGTMIVLGSDAHVDIDIANTKYSSKVLRDTEFPEELIANTSYSKLISSMKRSR